METSVEKLTKVAGDKSYSLSPEDRKILSKTLGQRSGSLFDFIATGDNLWENHRRFADINNELEADWMDLTAWGKGFAAGAIGNRAIGPVGGVASAIVVTTIESQKSEIAKREMEAKEKMEEKQKKNK